MLISEFINNIDKGFKETFTDKLINEIVRSIYANKVPVTDLKLKNTFGIYVFFYKGKTSFKTLAELEDTWYSEGIKKSPRVIKKNFSECLSIEDYYSFYVGKSEKVKSRVGEHLNHQKEHSTYGLKIKDRKNFVENDFQIGYWYLETSDEVSIEIKQFIITTIEQKIREKLNPLIGKK